MKNISLIFLGGQLKNALTLKSPGSSSHARWMAKVIYTHKIALFREQLKDHTEALLLTQITELAIF